MKRQCLIATIGIIWHIQTLLAQKPETVQYIFPLHNSTLNSRSSHIMIRSGYNIDKTTLYDKTLIKIHGSESGNHSGQMKLSTDHQTIIFKPDQLFDPGETVTVTILDGLMNQNGTDIPRFTFHFTITPLEEPLNPFKYIKNLNPVHTISEKMPPSLNKTVDDSLPDDFPHFNFEVTGYPGDGYLFLTPTGFITGNGYNLIIDNSGEIQYYNKITTGAPVDLKVLSNGMLSYGVMTEMFPFGGAGTTEFYMMDNTYTVIDSFQMGNGYFADFHEFQLLPNGHALLLTYDLQPVDLSQAVEGGHPGALVAGSIIQELDAKKNVIFQWRSWDYYELTDSYADLTQSMFDAIHINSIELDHDNHFLVSTLGLAEITKINRQTGDIIWRMGGKNNQFTFINEDDQYAPIYFMYQHDVRRLPNGNITLFDGGDPERELRDYSRVVEYQVDETNKTATNVWEYVHPSKLLAGNMGSAQRLDNGNTLICWGLTSWYGNPVVTEITPDGEIVLEMAFSKLTLTSYRAFKFDWNGGQPAAQVMRHELLTGNTKVFDTDEQQTGVSIKLNKTGGFGYNEVAAARYQYGPLAPEFPGKAPIVLPVRITLFNPINIFQYNIDISFDVDLLNMDKPDSILIYYREFENRGLFIPLPTTYNHVTREVKTTLTRSGLLQGEFIFTQQDLQSIAFVPILITQDDSGGVDQTQSLILEWTPVGFVNTYDLQVAPNEQFTDLIIDETYLTSSIYELESLVPNATYYWRVRSSNDGGTSDWSEAQMFQTSSPYITVTAPNGGETWQLGLNHFIQWNDNIHEDVIIELYQNESFLMEIDTARNSGGYAWEIPVYMDLSEDYKISIRSVERDSIIDMSNANFAIVDTVANPPDKKTFFLHQNFPNPFNAKTTIVYEIPTQNHVSLKVYNIRGEKILTLVNQIQDAAEYNINFNATGLSTGIYFYKITVGNKYKTSRKMCIIN